MFKISPILFILFAIFPFYTKPGQVVNISQLKKLASIKKRIKTTTKTPLIQHNISLKDKNWLKTGGPAHYFAAPTTAQDFQKALAFAKKHELPIFILGEGATVLISDEGFPGLVIHPQLKAITHKSLNNKEAIVTAGAGLSVGELTDYCLNHNITGLEDFSAIPSSIGGALHNNLYYFEAQIHQLVDSLVIIEKETGAIKTVKADWLMKDGKPQLHEKKHFVLQVSFRLKRCTPLETAYTRGRRDEITRQRVKRFPMSLSSGFFFKQLNENEAPVIIKGRKMTNPMFYLDQLNIKGTLQNDGAIVCHQHANMINNKGSATTADIINLARTIQAMALEKFGILLQPDCKLVGFENSPFLQKQS
ncbi:MAG TPA: FAD-binding protein [Candidatus Babeliales bacterium]|nr:FAD-binding protein [Candidatus Babeliales bacterium]